MSDCAYQCISLRLPGRLFLFVVSGSRRLFVTTPPKSYATTQCNDINQSQLTVAVSTTCYITKTIWTFTQNNNYYRRQHDNDQIHACCIKGDLSLHKTRKQWKEFIHCYISSYREGHNHTTTILWPFFRDHPGDPVPEENFWTLWCKGRLTEADTLTIRLGATSSGQTSAHFHHPSIFFMGRTPFLMPNQQRQSTEGKEGHKFIG